MAYTKTGMVKVGSGHSGYTSSYNFIQKHNKKMVKFDRLPLRKKIERWEQARRVLQQLPEHDRAKHWDMGTFGTLTECGTIACAAGHCGMDPWFKNRHFLLTIAGMVVKISSVSNFFGMDGSSNIFFNAAHRSVNTVIGEINRQIEQLRESA